jgi:indolepyruvate ferredoxin oxidoreductase beta subunit
MPVEGGVDVVVATELLEAARMVERGFVSPDRTFVLASTHRALTVPEKSARGDGALDGEPLLKAIEARSRARFLFDLAAACREAGAFVSAVVLGAIAGLEVLPIDKESFIAAMGPNQGGAANKRGFDTGYAIAAGSAKAPVTVHEKRAPVESGPVLGALARDIDAFPEQARDMVRIGVSRLQDYQDIAYARLYLDRLGPFRDSGPLLRELARHLAVRMSYEDIIRVAQLKVRPERFQRIRAEIGTDAVEPFEVTDFFKPGIPEIADLLPPGAGRWLLNWAARKPGRGKLNFGMRVRTTTINGFLRVWLLARLRFWRPFSLRYAEEQRAIEGWLGDVERARQTDAKLALQVCDLARIVKGYGDTHRRALATYGELHARLVEPVLQGQGSAKEAAKKLRGEIDEVLATH